MTSFSASTRSHSFCVEAALAMDVVWVVDATVVGVLDEMFPT